VLSMMRHPVEGTFNVVSRGCASRYEYVKAIVQSSGLPCVVEPGPAFRRKAKVSPNECAINARLQAMGLDQMPSWEDALGRYVCLLLAGPAWGTR
jgi:dTDP-4-dehydrorhamnose reductase